MSIPKHPFNAIVAGPYRETRIVEQFLDQFQNYMWIDLKSLNERDSWKDIVQPLKDSVSGGPGLVLIRGATRVESTYRTKVRFFQTALNHSRHSNLSILILDKNGSSKNMFPPAVRFQISHVFVESKISRYFMQTFSRRDLSKCSSIFDGQSGSWWLIEMVEEMNITPFQPWSRQVEWSPANHLNFPATVHDRVLLLLMAQYDQISLISKLDKNCMMEVLRCGAGMEEFIPSFGRPKLQLNTETVVLSQDGDLRSSYWLKRGIPGVYHHTWGSSDLIEKVVERQSNMLQKHPDKLRPFFIIIDLVPFEISRYQLMDSRLKIHFIDSQLWDIHVELPDMMYQMARSCEKE